MVMAEKNNRSGSVEDIQEQIKQLEKEKERLEKENREKKQLEEKLRSLRGSVTSLKSGASSSNAGPSVSERRSMGNNRDPEDQTVDLNVSLEETQAQLRALQQTILNTSGGAESSLLDNSRDDSFRSDDPDDDVMTSQHKQALRSNRDVLVENMTPDDIFNDLISKHILTNADVSRIKDKNTIEAINEELLNTLIRRSDRAFHVFVASLRRTLQGWLANRLDPVPQQRQKRKRGTGEVNVNVDCERVVPTSRKRFACTCQEVEEQILIMARGAFANVRRRDASASAFEQFKKELKQTNEVIKESMEIMNTLKILCRHGDLTDLSEGSICFTIRCSSLASCQKLWDLFESGNLLEICQAGLVTPLLLRICHVKEIILSVRISRLEYVTCALELANRELELLEKDRLRGTPIKTRLRQRSYDLQKENITTTKRKRMRRCRAEAFKDIPVNIVSSLYQLPETEASTDSCVSSQSSDQCGKADLKQEKFHFHSASASSNSDHSSRLNHIWLRSQGTGTG